MATGGRAKWRRKRVVLPLLAAILVAAFGWKAWHDTMADPVVERTTVALADYPTGAEPVTIALISDIHVAGPDMPPERLSRIVRQINALGPDIVMIAGDLVSEKRLATHIYEPDEIVAPLAELDAPLGVIAVPGNHDHWYDLPALEEEFAAPGMTMMVNEARQVGPLAIGGLDDDYTGNDDIPATLAAMEGMSGARVILSHSPDPFPALPSDIGLVLAGHTHCGQVAYPWGGAPATQSRYRNRYACNRVDEDGKVLIVGPGLGTSVLPFRLFTQPTIWLVTVRGRD